MHSTLPTQKKADLSLAHVFFREENLRKLVEAAVHGALTFSKKAIEAVVHVHLQTQK